MDNRYWTQPWYVKVWRHIHYRKWPLYVWNLWRQGLPFRVARGVATGLTQSYMGQVYTLDEVKDRMEHRINIRDK